MKNELINPFIVYWDIDTSLSDDIIIDRICDDLLNTKVFVLNLRNISSSLCSRTIKILNRLKNENIRTVLTVKGAFFGQSDSDLLKGLEFKRVYIEMDSLQMLRSKTGTIGEIVRHGHSAGISICISKENFGHIPEIIKFCLKNRINNIEFSIPRADDKKIYYPGNNDIMWLSKEIKKIPMDEMDLSIHDPFLWEIILKRANPDNQGCNGAKTMVYISENLDVTPCPVLPVVIGSLNSQSLKEIFLSEKRSDIRKSLSNPPHECEGCSLIATCIGGCRGRTLVLSGSINKKDPACLK